MKVNVIVWEVEADSVEEAAQFVSDALGATELYFGRCSGTRVSIPSSVFGEKDQ
jgi:hypothetical protein